MPSSLIAAVNDTLNADGPEPIKITESDRGGLLKWLAQVPDPRDPRGVRYPLASLLTVAVCAVMAGAVTFAAIGDWVEDLSEEFLTDVALQQARPVNTTLWRVLIHVDSVALTGVLASWLLSRNSSVCSESPECRSGDSAQGAGHDRRCQSSAWMSGKRRRVRGG